MADTRGVFQKIKENAKNLAMGGGIVLGIVFLCLQLVQRKEKRVERDVIVAERAFIQWKEGKEGALSEMESVIKKQKSLNAKYGIQIAQAYIIQKNLHKSEPYVRGIFERLPKETPFHRLFARTTLLIAQKEYLAALIEARNLKMALDTEKGEKVHMLKAFNLIRLACLEKTVGSAKGEFEAWRALEAQNKTTLALLNQVFEAEELSLAEYIAQRKGTISLSPSS